MRLAEKQAVGYQSVDVGWKSRFTRAALSTSGARVKSQKVGLQLLRNFVQLAKQGLRPIQLPISFSPILNCPSCDRRNLVRTCSNTANCAADRRSSARV